MTLLDIERDICRRLDKNATNLDPETKARLDTFINDRYRELMRLDGINLRDESWPLLTESGRYRYALPPTHMRINGITNVTSATRLQQRTLGWMREHDPGATSSGSPLYWVVLNEAGVQQQPAQGAVLEVVSNVTVTTSVVIEFQELTTGSWQRIVVLLDNATVVTVPTFPARVFRLYFEPSVSVPGALIVLREQVTQKIIARMPTAGTSVNVTTTIHQWVILLWPTPSGQYSLEVDFERPRLDLINDKDEPVLPDDFHTLLVWGGCADECLKMDDQRQQYYERKFQDDIRRLRAFLHHPRGERWIPGRRGRGYSDLGGHYPAG
jgi:hypothetical protein